MFDFNHKKILVTYLMYFGDLVTVTPFLEILRRYAPESEISLLVDKKLQDVVLYNPYIDHVETIDKKGKDNSIFGIWIVGKRLRDQRFDVTINLHPNERTSLICFLSKPKQLIGDAAFIFRLFWDIRTPINYKLHNAERFIDILNQLGIHDKKNSGLDVVISKAWRQKADEFYRENQVKEGEKIIGFHVGSAVARKCWHPKNFAKVADYFNRKGYRVVIFGSSADKEPVKKTISYMETKPIVATGKFTIGEFIAVVRRCDLFISNDSGPMHAAASQKLPIVGLFSSGNPTTFGPYGTNSICLKGKEVFEFINKSFEFIDSPEFVSPDEISVENVIQAAEKLLKL
jgi:hypothetical protein